MGWVGLDRRVEGGRLYSCHWQHGAGVHSIGVIINDDAAGGTGSVLTFLFVAGPIFEVFSHDFGAGWMGDDEVSVLLLCRVCLG